MEIDDDNVMKDNLEVGDAARRLMHLQTENFRLSGETSIMDPGDHGSLR
jgi:hypothetical protein